MPPTRTNGTIATNKESIRQWESENLATIFKEKDLASTDSSDDSRFSMLVPTLVKKATAFTGEISLNSSLRVLLQTFCLHFENANDCYVAINSIRDPLQPTGFDIKKLGTRCEEYLEEDLENYSRRLHKLRDIPMHLIFPLQLCPCILHFRLRTVYSLIVKMLLFFKESLKDDKDGQIALFRKISARLGEILGKKDPSHYRVTFNLHEGEDFEIHLDGNDCSKIMKEIDSILIIFFDTVEKRIESAANIQKYSDKTYVAWHNLLKVHYYDNILLKLQDRTINWAENAAEFENFKVHSESFRSLYLKLFGHETLTVYLELVCNGVMLQLLKHYKNLAIYDQQDFERQHITIKMNIRRQSNQKGTSAILYMCFRMLS